MDFRIIVLLHKLSALQGMNFNFPVKSRISGFVNYNKSSRKQQSSFRPSHYYHHVWLLVWFPLCELLCYTRCHRTQTFQKVKLIAPRSADYFPKRLGDHQDFFGKCEAWNSLDVVLDSFMTSWISLRSLQRFNSNSHCSSLDSQGP